MEEHFEHMVSISPTFTQTIQRQRFALAVEPAISDLDWELLVGDVVGVRRHHRSEQRTGPQFAGAHHRNAGVEVAA